MKISIEKSCYVAKNTILKCGLKPKTLEANIKKIQFASTVNRLFELSERYVREELSHSVPLVVRLVEEYTEGFESRYMSNI
ncbi:hypothetical protein BpHYR1_030411 [Brachionus plicatilis]|uniref:Uncharacterized protein n=1 Tax=Brachionus plicatilis TaxID=10195 RepID=A0A3M7P6F7_BRAPC|nr:hypothetical protein BpHYR1_030411 [Brachionus plicatilis]